MVEFAGKECVLDLSLGPNLIRARVSRDALPESVEVGAEVAVRIPVDRIHIFDLDSGRRI